MWQNALLLRVVTALKLLPIDGLVSVVSTVVMAGLLLMDVVVSLASIRAKNVFLGNSVRTCRGVLLVTV